MSQIITLTMNPALDKSASVLSIAPEIKMRCGAPTWQPGGGGINVARVVKRMGAKPLAVYPLGGHTGHMFQHLLDKEQLDAHPIPIAGAMRESFAVFEESTEQQYRFNYAGPLMTKAEQQACIDAVLAEMKPKCCLVLSGSLPPGVRPIFYQELVAAANQHDACVIVDSTGEPLRAALEAGVFLIKPNLHELHHFAGRTLESEREQIALLDELIGAGRCQAAVVSLGAGGVMLATKTGVDYIRAPIVPIRSKVGAGDSMVGGIVWSLAEGHSLHEAVRYGVAAGAACVMTPGTELAYAEDVRRLYAEL